MVGSLLALGSSLGSSAFSLGSSALSGLGSVGSWIGSNLGGLGQALGGLGGAVGSIFGSASSSKTAKKLAKYQAALQWDYQKKAWQEGYGYQREGLIAAGYNPMLALGGASANSFSPSGVPSAPVPDIVGSAKQGGDFLKALSSLTRLEIDEKKATVKAAQSAAQIAESEAKTKSLANKITRLIDASKLNALEDGSAYGVTVGLSDMQTKLRNMFADEWDLNAKQMQMMNTPDGLRALITEKMGAQAQSQLGKMIYDFLGDWLIEKHMRTNKQKP